MSETWRLIITPPMNGTWNMAIDEALLHSAATKQELPALRLYSWNPACLSLGYAQPFSEIDTDRLTQKGWTYVRRPTGGRAILHIDELTYSVTAPQDSPIVAGGVLESYRRLSGALLAGLKNLGISANADKEYDNSEEKSKFKPVCFEVPSNYEITANKKKLIGSAQSRKNGGVLQHGTLPLYGDISRITDVLKFPDESSRLQSKQHVAERAATLEEILLRRISWEDAAKAVINGFEQELIISFVKSELSETEKKLTEELNQSKYITTEWNCKN